MASHRGAVPSTGSPSTAPQPSNSDGNQANDRHGPAVPTGEEAPKKKKRHRAGKKRRDRRKSFAAPSEATDATDLETARPGLADPDTTRSSFYRMERGAARSNTSLESEALLDHRDQGPLQARRQSIQQGMFNPRASQPFNRSGSNRTSQANLPSVGRQSQLKSALSRSQGVEEDSGDNEDSDERTPLMSTSQRDLASSAHSKSFAYGGGPSSSSNKGKRLRRPSAGSSRSSRRPGTGQGIPDQSGEYDINNPPSVPGTPKFGPEMGYDDVMLTQDIDRSHSTDFKRSHSSRDILINIDDPPAQPLDDSPLSPISPGTDAGRMGRRGTLGNPAEEDVCFPHDGMSELRADFDRPIDNESLRHRRRRARAWPDLSVLDEWAVQEKEERTMEGIRARKVSEPLLVGGRLRPQKQMWHREDDDAPYRFTYFNEDFQSTVHSHTISELLQPGQTFQDLFIPEPPELSGDESDEDDSPQKTPSNENGTGTHSTPHQSKSRTESRNGSVRNPDRQKTLSGESTGRNTPTQSQFPQSKEKRHGPRPAFWLDVLSPTDTEMKILSKTFGIHPLTSEDIMVQEAREKVELFRNYYFVNYRTFEQDSNSEDYLEPVNMYVVVFREGVISFHFSMTPHPANVRRRIRQLSDYLYLTTDWISYALIDDITDAYAPMIQRIEEEVDDIDDKILRMNDNAEKQNSGKSSDNEKSSDVGGDNFDFGSDMLRRTGECRKKVMGLYRLLGNKADVIKGFAKRCNEQWEIAPRTEIGLYLGDIQDHIITMTGNLSHYENLLSRAHSNYLALINIRMNERAEKTNDVLGKLTVLGTIVLPMNIITGLWGMNCIVPGQDVESLTWFWCITGGLVAFGLICFLIAKRTYQIV